MWQAAAASAGLGIAGGILAGNASKKAAEAAIARTKEALALYGNIPVPEVKALLVEELKRQGVYEPGLEDSIMQQDTEFSKLQEDSGLRDAQMQALEQIKEAARGGLRMEDRAALNEVRNQTQRDVEAKRQQILQQQQAAGMGGSGASLAAQLAAAQGGAELNSQQGMDIAAEASRRALQAIAQQSQMAGNVRSQDYAVASDRARAADELNRFNVQNRRDVQQRNVASQNQGQRYNLEEDQRLAEQNIANRRAEQLRQEDAKQNQFSNRMSIADRQANLLGGLGKQEQARGQITANQISGVAGSLAGAMGNQQGLGGSFNKIFNSSGGNVSAQDQKTREELDAFDPRTNGRYTF